MATTPEQGFLIPEARPTIEPPPPAFDGYLPQPAKEPPVRVIYGGAGRPTAAILHDWQALVDTTAYWIECEQISEARYLCAIINSNVLFDAVEPLMPKGQWGARNLEKHIWRLPIPEFDPADPLHADIAAAGAACIRAASLMKSRIEVRTWMQDSPEAQRVEALVAQLLDEETDDGDD